MSALLYFFRVSEGEGFFEDAMSMTNRYRTSLLTTRSYARLISSGRINSTSAVMLRAAQSSMTSCVSAMPPIMEPARLFLPKPCAIPFRPCRSPSAPTLTSVASSFQESMNGCIGYAVGTVEMSRSK